ncbi:MAG TPA: hypothetical protein VK675_03025 [Candidatus Paceibacterota bacterium]|nr:hypothetical protein [Candidatus Paceibacterota bacterium]
MNTEITVGDLFADNRSPLTVIREDNGQRILVHPMLVEYVSADRVKILVPGKEGVRSRGAGRLASKLRYRVRSPNTRTSYESKIFIRGSFFCEK